MTTTPKTHGMYFQTKEDRATAKSPARKTKQKITDRATITKSIAPTSITEMEDFMYTMKNASPIVRYGMGTILLSLRDKDDEIVLETMVYRVNEDGWIVSSHPVMIKEDLQQEAS